MADNLGTGQGELLTYRWALQLQVACTAMAKPETASLPTVPSLLQQVQAYVMLICALSAFCPMQNCPTRVCCQCHCGRGA